MLGGVHKSSLASLQYARTLSDDVRALHVSIDPEDTRRIAAKWEKWGGGVPLVILESPYRLFIEPVLDYIEQLDQQREPGEVITIVVPQFITSRWLNFLHARTADTLRKVLLAKENVVIIEVPYRITEPYGLPAQHG
jgi:hypothetical protein